MLEDGEDWKLYNSGPIPQSADWEKAQSLSFHLTGGDISWPIPFFLCLVGTEDIWFLRQFFWRACFDRRTGLGTTLKIYTKHSV